MSEEKQPKPTSIDELLKQMLLENPSLVKELTKSVPAEPSQPKTRERKAPEKDFFLQVYSGCETCHAITITTYNMKWDSITGVFRPKVFCLKDKLAEGETEIKTQSLTSSTCVSCHSELSQLGKDDLVRLLINLTNPEAGIIRLVELKRKLRRLEK